MLEVLETILSPVVWLMELVLNFYISIIGSAGLSVLLLSFTFSLLLMPLAKRAQRTEKRVSERMTRANAEVAQFKGKLKGENLFLETERIYQKHGYHPIQSVGVGASLFVMLPVLISALFLFAGDGVLSGKSFLLIPDLSKPDGLLGPVNLMPFIMSGITLFDARLRFQGDKQAQVRFGIIAVVLLILVYNLASGLVLYWTGSNMMSLFLNRIGTAKHPTP